MRNTCLLLAVFVTAASALVTAYHVEPRTAAMSGKAGPVLGVSQVLTCCWDELDAASGSYCELFAGETLSGGYYKVDVYDYPGGINRVAYNEGTHAKRPQDWVRMPLTMAAGKSFTKGKLYEFRFTRSGSDSIQFYYQVNDPYPYQYCQMLVGGQPYQSLADLAMRVHARMKPVDRSFWGGFAKLPYWNGRDSIWNDRPNRRHAWQTFMSQTGWALATFDCRWREHEPDSLDWRFYDTDTHIWQICSTGARPVGILWSTPTWISSRLEKKLDPSSGDTWYDSIEHCAPRNLWPGPSETNYYARWVDKLLSHKNQEDTTKGVPADSVHTWIIWNEPNDTFNYNGSTGWWRRPNLAYETGFDSLPGLCSLYMRMAWVADSVIRSNDGHQYDTILIGAMHRATDSNPYNLVKGVRWLDLCYQTSEDSVFWDGVAVHPYQEQHDEFSAEDLEFSAETLRAVMQKKWGDYQSELWNTELGWNTRTLGFPRESDANNLCEAYATSFSLPALPGAGGGYDRLCWWTPYYPSTDTSGKPVDWNWMWLQDDTTDGVSLIRQYGYYAFKQACSTLVGKRFNGRVTTGDDETDSMVRMYEFEDTATLKKTWVCWRSDSGVQDVAVELPARADSAYIEALAYEEGTPPNQMRQVNSYGWLGIGASDRPQFVTEPANESITRPELAVDSSTATTVRRRMARWLPQKSLTAARPG
jgi:hypothetical protein